MSISVRQTIMARAALDLSQPELGEAVGITGKTVANIESGKPTTNKTLDKLRIYFEAQGLEFLDNDGVRMRPQLEQITLRGQDGMRSFYDDVYEQTKETGKEILIFNGMPNELIEWAGEEWYYEHHVPRMEKLNCVSKNIIEEDEENLIGRRFAQYKWIPKEDFHSKMIYVYGNKFAYMSFVGEALIKITEEEALADTFRVLINIAWEKAAQNI